MSLRQAVSALLFFGIVASGCGSSDDNGAATGATGGNPDTFISEIAAATCAYAKRCFSSVIDAQLHGADCVAAYTKQFEDGEPGVVVGLAKAGKVSFDAAKGSACLKIYANASCDARPDFSGCEDVALGAAKTGDPCSEHEECGASGFCKAGATCPGTCQPRIAANAACALGDECERGSTCSGTTCMPDVQLGGACAAAGASCADGLSCKQAESGKPGECVVSTLPFTEKLGDPCKIVGGGPYCATGGVCALEGDALTAASTYRCVAPSAAGGECGVSLPDSCPLDEYCPLDLNTGKAKATCTKRPAVGEACGKGLSDDNCGVDAACVTGQCLALQRLGGACLGADQCYSKTCTNGKCVAPSDCQPRSTPTPG